jgi:hypothetical protein
VNLLRRIFERSEPDRDATEECRHEALVPHWDDASRIGEEAAISSYRCTTCDTVISPERAQAIEQERITRLRRTGF